MARLIEFYRWQGLISKSQSVPAEQMGTLIEFSVTKIKS